MLENTQTCLTTAAVWASRRSPRIVSPVGRRLVGRRRCPRHGGRAGQRPGRLLSARHPCAVLSATARESTVARRRACADADRRCRPRRGHAGDVRRTPARDRGVPTRATPPLDRRTARRGRLAVRESSSPSGLGVMARMAVMLAIIWLVRPRGHDPERAALKGRRLHPSACRRVVLSRGRPVGVPAARHRAALRGPLLPALGAVLRPWRCGPRSPCAPGVRRRTPLAGEVHSLRARGRLILVAAVIVPVVHGPIEPRDLDIQKQIDSIAPAIPSGATLGGCPEGEVDWRLRAYLQRFFRASLGD